MFEKAQSLAPTNARLISDLGRTYAMQASRESSPEKKKIASSPKRVGEFQDLGWS
jgi:hypothetical protein